MSKIAICDLRLAGANLLSDPESYMYELDDCNVKSTEVNGGCLFLTPGIYFGMVVSAAILNQ
uniref:Uncharacterized protein n=1 Tax=Synechocystis sp. PCC 9413 TaxID=77760 RepID=A0A2P0ZGD1_9SYNC|nr:hypothetical protein [Synechocystis sp. PCC 9413]